MSGRKKAESKLGRGLDALIPGEVSEAEEVISDEVKSGTVISGKVITDEVGKEVAGVSADEVISDEVKSGTVTTAEARVEGQKIPREVVEKAISEGLKNPRIVVWSKRSSIAMRILKKTIPEFSISEVTREIIEEGIRKRYPEVWKIVESEVQE